MKYVKGDIFTKDGFKKGCIGFEHNKIVEIRSDCPNKSIVDGFIVPTFINSHTHIGDSFIKTRDVDLPHNLIKLVAPPHGLKHRLLKDASDVEIIGGMKRSIQDMIKSGISCFCDFREGGIDGINQIRNAMRGKKNIDSVVLSRPKDMTYDRTEIYLLLQNSDGIGISSISDWDYSDVKKISYHVHQQKKIFALHASEMIREDIDLILDSKPDFLIHMTKATKSDLIRVKDNDIPIVLCPRSNAFFGLKTNAELMKKIGLNLMLGTDNAMLNTPNILDELKYLKKNTKGFSIEELMYMITYNPRKALNLDCDILVQNSPSNFVVLDRGSLEIVYVPNYMAEG